ncbi:hypothetical protein [Paenibacillus sp. MBLB4367]|uniref:hypothetical protein n=1 Tax=Paenibacillus sp. MBLB4367 TaxID=3384767 RepID=UPI0039084565
MSVCWRRLALVWLGIAVTAASAAPFAGGAAAMGTETRLKQDHGPVPHTEARVVKTSETPALTILMVPGLSFQELREPGMDALPEIGAAIRGGAVGGVNVRLSGNRLVDVYLTLGAGRPAYGTPLANGWNRTEKVAGSSAEEQMLRFRAGGPPEGEILVPLQSKLAASNASSSYAAKPGELGELLKARGVPRYVWGSTDLGRSRDQAEIRRQRFAPLMAMDASGAVTFGDVGPRLLADDRLWPYGVRTDVPRILSEWKNRSSGALSIIELGDLYRLYEEKDGYERSRFEEMKRTALREIDRFFGEVRSGLRAGEELWLFAPKGNAEAYGKFDRLSPLVIYRGGAYEGLLGSASTRRAGIVTMFDMTVSIARLFGAAAPLEWMGSPFQTVAIPDGLSRLQNELAAIGTVYGLRPKLLYSWTIVEIGILLAAIVGIVWLQRGRRSNAGRSFRVPLAAVLTAPAIMLVMGWFAGMPAAGAALFFAAAVAALSIWLARHDVLTLFIGAGIGTAGLILLDGWTGEQAMKRSVLGYDPLIGARYYGIGNEFMGVLIGALVLGVSAWLQRRHDRSAATAGAAQPPALAAAAPAGAGRRPPGPRKARREREKRVAFATALLFAFTALYLALPGAGTNAGGAITAMIAFGIAWWRMHGGPGAAAPRGRGLLRGAAGFALAAIAALAAIWLVNRALPSAGPPSHIGRALQQLADGRYDLIGLIIVRKLQMNAHLIGVSIWSKVVLTGIFVMAVLVLRPRGVFRRWLAEYPYIMHGIAANIVGAIAALLFNDSGIVAAGTMIGFIAVPMLALRLRECEKTA